MFADNGDNYRVLSESISGERAFDEQAFSAVAVFAERLERLKQTNPMFDGVGFSPMVDELASVEMISALS